MTDFNKPSDRAIAQAFMHEVWNTQVKDGDASRLINRVLHYAREIDAQQPKDKSAERQPTFAYLAIGKYESYLVFGELIFGLPTNRVESGKALRGKYESYLVFRADFEDALAQPGGIRNDQS